MYLATVGSVISMPSFSNSPWMRGAPQHELLRLIIRIRSRTCGQSKLHDQPESGLWLRVRNLVESRSFAHLRCCNAT